MPSSSSIILHVPCINISFLPIKDTRNYAARNHVHDTSSIESIRLRGGRGMGRGDVHPARVATAGERVAAVASRGVRSVDLRSWHVRGAKTRHDGI